MDETEQKQCQACANGDHLVHGCDTEQDVTEREARGAACLGCHAGFPLSLESGEGWVHRADLGAVTEVFHCQARDMDTEEEDRFGRILSALRATAARAESRRVDCISNTAECERPGAELCHRADCDIEQLVVKCNKAEEAIQAAEQRLHEGLSCPVGCGSCGATLDVRIMLATEDGETGAIATVTEHGKLQAAEQRDAQLTAQVAECHEFCRTAEAALVAERAKTAEVKAEGKRQYDHAVELTVQLAAEREKVAELSHYRDAYAAILERCRKAPGPCFCGIHISDVTESTR